MKTKIEKAKVEALAKYLEIDTEDAEMLIENNDYLVLTDKEADETAREYILDSLWAFNADFIIDVCEFDHTMKKSLEKMQQDQCENCNDFILALINGSCGIDFFIENALTDDGRGHFISFYDGNEIEQDDYFIYRQN